MFISLFSKYIDESTIWSFYCKLIDSYINKILEFGISLKTKLLAR